VEVTSKMQIQISGDLRLTKAREKEREKENLACLLSLSVVDPIPMVAFPFVMGSTLGLARRRCRMGNVPGACMFGKNRKIQNTQEG